MRYIVLDTETTGLSHQDGHRIIEIGCIEIVNRKVTESNFHIYLDPEREIDAGAQRVHGISSNFLKGKPKFADIAEQLLAYLGDASLIIHNAAFDLGFLNAEFARLGKLQLAKLEETKVIIDTLMLSRNLFPGQRHNLDALAKRYNIDVSARKLHGALLDASILAQAYLAMTGGQTTMEFAEETSGKKLIDNILGKASLDMDGLVVHYASMDELAEHQKYLTMLHTSGAHKYIW